MSLKGGLGVSLVNSTPEELVYISLQNISLDYISNANSTTADISVANVQVKSHEHGSYDYIYLEYNILCALGCSYMLSW